MHLCISGALVVLHREVPWSTKWGKKKRKKEGQPVIYETEGNTKAQTELKKKKRPFSTPLRMDGSSIVYKCNMFSI